jgi:hypothetical protein
MIPDLVSVKKKIYILIFKKMPNRYKNCIDTYIRIKFDNDIIKVLEKNNCMSIGSEVKIVSVEKYVSFATLNDNDVYKWSLIGFEVDNSNCIREISRESIFSSVKSIL